MNQNELDKLLQHEKNLPFYEVTFNNKPLRFAVTNQKCFYFAHSIPTREPDTNEWISKLTKDDVFFDIGANNCVFTILASAIYGARSYAFEPHFASYYISQQNIYSNKLEELASLFPVAVAEETSFGNLYLSSTTAGKSLNNFGDSRPSADPLWNAIKPQASVSMSIDDICAHLGVCPSFIKIDVDGIESKIVKGASKTLKNPSLKEIMIEFDKDKDEDIKAAQKLYDSGFILDIAGPSGYFFRR
jgi:FkbM family methyltransferase